MVGAGARVVATQKNFTQGDVESTDNSLDLMINGAGFFEIEMPDGTTAYTRNGQFTTNEEGVIVTAEGYTLLPEITIPEMQLASRFRSMAKFPSRSQVRPKPKI